MVDGDVAINETNFPDATFRQYVLDNIDKDGNGVLSQAEMNAVCEIDVSGTYYTPSKVADLSGIEFFTELENLCCSFTLITSLDLSSNIDLIDLYCVGTLLTNLSLTKNNALQVLYCDGSQLTSLDVRKNTDLKVLNCHDNKLTSLDVSQNKVLDFLDFSGNRLNNIDLSNLFHLGGLRCDGNPLDNLDLKKNKELIMLYCNDVPLISLDVSNNTSLMSLDCRGAHLTSLDLTNNSALTQFMCSENSFYVENNAESYPINNLPAGFDSTKASNRTGATYDEATNSLTNFTSDTVTYDYDCGNGKTATFTLILGTQEEPAGVSITMPRLVKSGFGKFF